MKAFKQTGPRNPLDRVSARKGPRERDYGEACAVGSCSEDSSTKRDLDFTESGPNGPKRTREWLKIVSPKNAQIGETGRGLRPQNPTGGRYGSALTFAQAKSSRNDRRREGRSSDHRRLLDTRRKKKALRPPQGSS